LPISQDFEHETLRGVQIGRPTKLVRMVEEITSVLNKTGEFLVMGGYESLGTFVIECAKKSKIDEGKNSASRFVYRVRFSLGQHEVNNRWLTRFQDFETWLKSILK